MVSKLFFQRKEKKQQCVKILLSLFIPFLSVEQSPKKNVTFSDLTNSGSFVFFHCLWYFPICFLDLSLRKALEEGLGCQNHVQGDSETCLFCFRLSAQ